MHKINQYNNNLNIIGSKIKELRREQKLSQEFLCARMQVMGYKISRSDISKIETGKKFISDFEVLGFAKALKTTITKLYEGLE
ncbi:MAG: helix-turn-helix transcriptional regulator [Clostridia bacterium]|nr:helix-turn-helix transcriptional regulator [Clostridia bacterium]